MLADLCEEVGNRDIDDFDLICHIAFDKKLLSRAERAANVRKRDYLSKYEDVAREVLSVLLDKYTPKGVADLERIDILRIDPFLNIGMKKIFKAFVYKQKYLHAVK